MNMTLPRQITSFLGPVPLQVADLSQRMNGMDSGKAGFGLLRAAGSAMFTCIAVGPFQAGLAVPGVRWELIRADALTRPRGLE